MKHLRLVCDCTYAVFEAVIVGLFGIYLWARDGVLRAFDEWEQS